MAISNIPVINGPSFGGVIYGLNLQVGYSNSPSKLIVDIVNETGIYSTPKLNSQISISFGSFRFNGIIWSYNIKQTAEERILQIEIIDNSIILDRYYVLLWKRGLFNDNGASRNVIKEIDLSDQTIIVPIVQGSNISFQERQLGRQNITRNIHFSNKVHGNIICLGTEDFPDSTCDIPDTNYTFNDLNTLISNIVGRIDFNTPDGYKASHEGKLRDVLKAWAADCGLDFYWDFQLNKVVVFPVGKGINVQIPNFSNTPELIESSSSLSMEGTFAQHALAYTAYPKEDLKTVNRSIEKTITNTINAFPVSYFLKRNNTLQSLNLSQSEEGTTDDPSAAERNLWGGRLEDEFLSSAFLGYISEDLRDLYCIQYNLWNALGFGVCDTVGGNPNFERSSIPVLSEQDKSRVIDELTTLAPEDLKELRSIDNQSLTSYNFILGVKNDSLNNSWKTIEQEILQSYGSVYRHNIGSSYASFYCTSSSVIEINVSVEPEPEENEPKSTDFKGLKIFRRSGTMSHSANQAAELLGLNDPQNLESLQKLRIREFDIISSGLKSKLFPETKGTTLFIVPKANLINKVAQKFDAITTNGFNDLESTIFDIAASNDQKNKCDPFDLALQEGKCVDSRSEALEKEYKKLLGTESDENSPISGLTNNKAKAANIDIFGKRLKIHAPSNGSYQTVTNISINVEQISNFQDGQKIFFNNDGPTTADDVAEMDVIYDNVTDSNDSYGKQRKESIPLARSVSNKSAREIYKFVFAGQPPSNLNLSPSNGINSLDISLSSNGFKTSVEFSSRPPQRVPVETFLRKVESQFNRKSFNST